ncbi:MAG: HAD-IIIC family phosphatase, partial [Rhodospirillaceae bacterium]|nr:HAD-IIIC family phosphatase [Rhodospirillaceae bacterium]
SHPAEKITRLAKRFNKSPALLREAGPPLKVAVLSSFLTDYLVEILPLMFARRGFTAEISAGPYGVMAAALLDETSSIHTENFDLLLLLPSYLDLAHLPPTGCTKEEAESCVQKEADFWASLWKRLPGPCVQMSFGPPPLRPLGELDAFAPGGATLHGRRTNMELATRAPASLAFIDSEALAYRLGKERWHAPRLYHMCKQPFSFDAVAHIADCLAAASAGIFGRGRKVLVLDLDNTLWGGVIGDDGMQGIEIGPETEEGEAFSAFQAYILKLRQRGVILAACSKNADSIARQPFREHPAMILTESDFSAFVANFEDKASNLKRIAEELNVGLDSLVLVDDSPVEREWVRTRLPEVMVIDLPDDPAGFASALDDARAFPLIKLTSEDIGRADSYTNRTKTKQAMAATKDMDSFLAGLKPVIKVESVGPGTVERIAQLIAKTNQFKINPRTFTAEEIIARGEHVIALRLTDRLQDYGIVSVAVTKPGEGKLEIENWVMSCRVFSRRLEYVMRQLLAEAAKAEGAERLDLNLVETDRNGLLKDILPQMGFETRDGDGKKDVETIWSSIAQPPSSLPAHHMKIV